MSVECGGESSLSVSMSDLGLDSELTLTDLWSFRSSSRPEVFISQTNSTDHFDVVFLERVRTGKLR